MNERSITITFTEAEVKALDLCLNAAGNAEAWLGEQPYVIGGRYIAEAIKPAAMRIARMAAMT